jgi:hypothetical protein
MVNGLEATLPFKNHQNQLVKIKAKMPYFNETVNPPIWVINPI